MIKEFEKMFGAEFLTPAAWEKLKELRSHRLQGIYSNVDKTEWNKKLDILRTEFAQEVAPQLKKEMIISGITIKPLTEEKETASLS